MKIKCNHCNEEIDLEQDKVDWLTFYVVGEHLIGPHHSIILNDKPFRSDQEYEVVTVIRMKKP